MNNTKAYATNDMATAAMTCTSAVPPPEMPAKMAAVMTTPPVGPWIPTDSAITRQNRSRLSLRLPTFAAGG